ncbi:Rv1535 family protein [Mycobacterium sp.]|uniref:Rv1535 family protein n=1 Tax=Mycobacterium sp. TaxID=1785 RepID=UPI0025EE0694|nr:Rv1535 family protein [Mycobacterium sp.]MBW0014227.1 hypothetical protein [Mycobacterium sp.]
MTAVLYDEVVTAAPARKLTVVRDNDTAQATIAPLAPKKTARSVETPPFGVGGDPLVDGAARLLTVGVRHVYAALWRVGVLEVRV